MVPATRDLLIGLAVAVLVVMPVVLMSHAIPYVLIYPGQPLFTDPVKPVKLSEMAVVMNLRIRKPVVKTEVWVTDMDRMPAGWRLVDTGTTSRMFVSAEGDTGVEAVVVMRDTADGRWGSVAGAARWVNGVVAAMNEREGR